MIFPKNPNYLYDDDCLHDKEEYMNPKQLNYFYNILIDEKNRILSTIADSSEKLKKSLSVLDTEDVVLNNSIKLKKLHEIDEAIVRINDQTYGYCENTGEEIGINRLKYMPTAKYSVFAQEKIDLYQKNLSFRNRMFDE